MKRVTLFVSLSELADLTGLPLAWLRQQAHDGIIPSLTIGTRRRFNPDAVAEVLARAGNTTPPANRPRVATAFQHGEARR